MAIFHFDASTGSRAGGQSASAKHDYIVRDGRYTYRKDSDPCLYEVAGNMPAWASQDASLYWKAADDHERSNGRLFKHLEIALLDELNLEQNKILVARFVKEITSTPDGLAPFEYAIHAGKVGKGHPENLHAHIMISERILDGLDRTPEVWFKRAATKDQDPSKYGSRKTLHFKPEEWLANSRKRWAEVANEALNEAGHDVRIDHRTLNEQKYEALELGLFDRALELNRSPKRRTPRAAYEFELATGEDSAWRKENSEFLTTREEKEAEERKNFADLVEKMRSKVTELEEAQVEPAEEITPAKPKTILQKPAPSMTDRMTAFFRDAVEKVIEKAQEFSKSMAWAKKAVLALFDEVQDEPAEPVEVKEVQKAKDVQAVKEDETKKPEPAEDGKKDAQEVNKPRNSGPRKRQQVKTDEPSAVNPEQDTMKRTQEEETDRMVAKLQNRVYQKAMRAIEESKQVKEEPPTKDIQQTTDQVEKPDPAQATKQEPKVKKPRNSSPRKRQQKPRGDAQEVKQEDAPLEIKMEDETASWVSKLQQDVYQRAIQAIKAGEQPELPKPKT